MEKEINVEVILPNGSLLARFDLWEMIMLWFFLHGTIPGTIHSYTDKEGRLVVAYTSVVEEIRFDGLRLEAEIDGERIRVMQPISMEDET